MDNPPFPLILLRLVPNNCKMSLNNSPHCYTPPLFLLLVLLHITSRFSNFLPRFPLLLLHPSQLFLTVSEWESSKKQEEEEEEEEELQLSKVAS